MSRKPSIIAASGAMSDFPHMHFAEYGGATRETDVSNAVLPKFYTSKIIDALYERTILAKLAVDITDEASNPAEALRAFKEVALSGDGTTSDGTALEGNEERVSLETVDFDVEELDHAVAFTKTALLLPAVELRKRAEPLLSNWFNIKVEGKLLTSAENGAGTVFYGGNATAPANIDAADTSAPVDIKKAYFYLMAHKVPGYTLQQLKGWFGDQVDNLAGKSSNPRGGFYVAVLHPGQIYDITETTEWKTAANASATATIQVALGPNFQATIYVWYGVLLIPDTLCVYTKPAGYAVAYARGFVFGQDALAFGFQKLNKGQVKFSGLEWQEAGFDYNRLTGVAILTRFAEGVLDNSRYVAHYSALSTAAIAVTT